MLKRTKSQSTRLPAKIGRPTKYSTEWAEQFCARIAEGQSVAEICGRRDQPSQQSVYTWLREDEDFLERYARARDAQADKFFKECLEIADKVEHDHKGGLNFQPAVLVQIGGNERGEVIDADDVSDKLITSTYDQTVSC